MRRPVLIGGSRHDRYLPVSDTLALLRRAGTKDKRTALYPGGFHGRDIVEGAPYAARAPRPRPAVDSRPVVTRVSAGA